MSLVFYEASHRYKLDGQWVPGVTSILGCLDKPALPKWAAKSVAEYVATNTDAVETLRSLGPNAMTKALAEIPWQKRDDAAYRGNVLHDYFELLVLGKDVDVPDEHAGVVEGAIRFMDTWQIRPVLAEAPVASREHQYAGTLDLIADYVHPTTGEAERGIFDWKSGSGIYAEVAWQMAAYGHADFALVDGEEQPVPTCTAAFGVHTRPDGTDAYPVAYSADVFAEFVAIRNVFDAVKRGRGDWKRPGSGYVGVAVTSEAGAA